ncbi:hypothetical protein [Mycolicibacterium fortuitum]|uniref:hypothetical protein n=1 Tax=Mycolicibacterium fortuitum TaxID=1766 RepID=UPI001F364EBC|nr:hypothetical protein [Mycolicibacterium fortuitum]
MAEHLDIAVGGALVEPLHRTVVTGSLLQARDETPTSGTSGESGQRHRPPQPALGYMVVMFCHRTAPTGLVS